MDTIRITDDTIRITYISFALTAYHIKEPSSNGIKEPSFVTIKRESDKRYCHISDKFALYCKFSHNYSYIAYHIKRFHLLGQDKDVYNLHKIVTYFL